MTAKNNRKYKQNLCAEGNFIHLSNALHSILELNILINYIDLFYKNKRGSKRNRQQKKNKKYPGTF